MSDKSRKRLRSFKVSERVYVENDKYGFKAIVAKSVNEAQEGDLVLVHALKNTECDDSSGIETCKEIASNVYQIADNKSCPRCNGTLYREHHDEIDYPYYCPDCQENFYDIEI